MWLGLSAGVANAGILPTFTFTGSTWDATFGKAYSRSFADNYVFSAPAAGLGGAITLSGFLTGWNTLITGFWLENTTTATTLGAGFTPSIFSFFSFVIPNTADNYTLHVSGTALSSLGGSYSGNMSISAIPEPETYAMILAGLGLLGFAARRRKTNNFTGNFA